MRRSLRQYTIIKLSELKPILAGVPQGSTLFPLLYNLYVLDIPKFIATELAIYADASMMGSTVQDLLVVQQHLNEIGDWATQWPINNNTDKTKALIFSERTRLKFLELRLHNASIEYIINYC